MAEFALLKNSKTGAEWYGPVTYALAHPDWSPVDNSVELGALAEEGSAEVRLAPGFAVLHNNDLDQDWVGPASYASMNTAWRPADDSVEVPSLAAGTVDEVLASVGDDPVLAQAALDAEKASSKPRTTLVDRLSDIAKTS